MTEHLKLNSLPPVELESIQGKGIYKMAGRFLLSKTPNILNYLPLYLPFKQRSNTDQKSNVYCQIKHLTFYMTDL